MKTWSAVRFLSLSLAAVAASCRGTGAERPPEFGAEAEDFGVYFRLREQVDPHERSEATSQCEDEDQLPSPIDGPFDGVGHDCWILEVPALVVVGSEGRLAGDPNPIQRAPDLLAGPFASTTASRLSDVYGRAQLAGYAGSPLDGLDVDALSLGLDWIPLRLVERPTLAGAWALDLSPPMGWALLTFTHKDKISGLAWGEALAPPNPLPTVVSGQDGRKPLLSAHDESRAIWYFDFDAAEGYQHVRGLDQHAWYLTEELGSSAGGLSPIPARYFAEAPRSLTLYFSVSGAEESLRALEARLSRVEIAKAAGWRSGASIFSYRLRFAADGTSSWEGPVLEFAPGAPLDSPHYLGLEPGEDVDALAIDVCKQLIVASLTKEGDGRPAKSGLYAWSFAAPKGGMLEEAYEFRPTPLLLREDLSFENALAGGTFETDLPVPTSESGLARTLQLDPIEVDGSCAQDPGHPTQ